MKTIKLRLKVNKESFKKRLGLKNGKDGENGISPDLNLLAIEAADQAVERLKPFIPTTDELKKEILGAPVRDSLEALEGEDRLDIKAVKGLEKYEERIHSLEIRPIGKGGGARGLMLYTNGTKRGMIQSLNLIPGTNVTLTYSYAFGRQDVTISASGSGGGLSVLTVTGTVDDSNLSFTVASQPTLVIINGASYRTTSDSITWTYLAGTLTLSQAVGAGGSIYALG